MEILKWTNTISEMKTSLEKPNNKFKLAKGRPNGEKCYQNGSTRVSTILPSKNTSVDTNRCECLHGCSRIQQESSRTLLRQKHPRLDPLKVMNGLILCVSLQPLLGGTAQCQQMVSSWFLPWGEARVCDWAPDFPGFVGRTEKACFFFTSSKILSHNYTTWGSTAVLGEQQPRLGREHIKGAWMLLTALGTPSGNPPMSHRNRLLYRFSSWLMGTAKLHTPHSNMSLPCDCLPEQPWRQEC